MNDKVKPDPGPTLAGKDLSVPSARVAPAAATHELARDPASREAVLNRIELDIDRSTIKLDGEAEAKRSAWASKGRNTETPAPRAQPARDNQVTSDEVFTATQSEVKLAIVEAKFRRDGTKFYEGGSDAIAFEDKGNKLETSRDTEPIAQSMVAIAQARGWDEIKLSGSEVASKLEAGSQARNGEDFRVRESAELARARAFATQTAAQATKEHPELAGTYAAVAAVAKKLDADNLSKDQRTIVMQRVQQNIMKALEAGATTRVNVRESKEVARHISAEREIGR